MVGTRHYDDCRLWGHGAQNVRWHVRGRPVRVGRCAHDSPPGASHCLQLRYVLFPYPGEGEAPQEEEKSAARRAAQGAQVARSLWWGEWGGSPCAGRVPPGAGHHCGAEQAHERRRQVGTS